MAKLTKADLRLRGGKIAESHALRKATAERFPLGALVRHKYLPLSVGLVMSKPIVRRFDKYRILPAAFVNVLWMAHPYMPTGEILQTRCTHLLIKKVLESGK